MIKVLRKLRSSAPRAVLFYLLGFYVLLQFAWWAYMLVDLNREIYQLNLQLLQVSNAVAPEQLILKADLDHKLSLKVWMVLGEGAVFVAILLMGFRAVRNSIVKELRLAEQQKNFLLSITHELKSPLAAVKLQLQTLVSRELPPEKQQQLYGRALNDTHRLEKLVENLLLVNKVESGRLPLVKKKLNLDRFVKKILEDNYPEEFSSGRIIFESDSELHAQADAMALQSVLVNLIDNALKYGNGSDIAIKLISKGQNAELCVTDNGIGIPGGEKKKVFERFYRIGNENVRKTKGTGIGLYLVKLLVEGHDGNIRVEDNRPSGAVFIVTLPLDEG